MTAKSTGLLIATMDLITTRPKRPTTFLDLPAELRNYIYDLSGCLNATNCTICLEHETQRHLHLCINWHPDRWSKTLEKFNCGDEGIIYVDHHRDAVQPPLTRVNRQIREETLSMFYHGNAFVFKLDGIRDSEECSYMEKFMRVIGHKKAAMLGDVRIVYAKKAVGRWIKRELVWKVSSWHSFPALAAWLVGFGLRDHLLTLEKLRQLGVRTDLGVVRCQRLGYPFCDCARCVRRCANAM